MRERGQMILLVLLIAAVIMTLGLSLSKRSVGEIKIDVDEELSKKAFDTAESGINYYKKTDQAEYNVQDESGTSKANIAVSALPVENSVSFSPTSSGNSEYFWLVNHGGDGSLGSTYFDDVAEVCMSTGYIGAIKIDYFYLDGTDYKVRRYGFNIGNSLTKRVEGFTDLGVGAVCSGNLDFAVLPHSVLLAITPVFSDGTISVVNKSGGKDFPSQGNEITSVGQAGNIESMPVNRSVKVIDRYKVPGFLLEAISAEGNISN